MRMGQITGARNRAPARFFFVKNNIFHIDARSFWHLPVRQRPYCAECTRSHPNSEVKQRKARIVLGWGTAWEVLRVPLAFYFFRKKNAFPRPFGDLPFRQRPYCAECTRSHPNSEVKQRKARIVLGWGTAWEVLRVPLAFIFPQKNTTKTPPQEIMKKQNWRIWLKTMQKNALADFPDNTISRATWSRETGETS